MKLDSKPERFRLDSKPEILKQRFNFCRWIEISFGVLLLVVLATGTVYADPHDGTGTMTVSPTSAVPGSTGNSFTFSFIEGTPGDFPTNSAVTVTVPSGWTAPQTTNALSPGYISYVALNTTVDSIAVSGSGPWTVAISFDGSNSDSGFNLTYAGGGTGVTAPTSLGIYTFTTQSQGGTDGTLTAIATSPTITNSDSLVVSLPGETFISGVGNSGTVSNQTAGTAFNLTLYAVGAGGTVLDTTYSGTKTITYSGPDIAPGGTAPGYTMNVTFINGVATNITTTLTAAETTTITASAADGTATGVASSSLTVDAGTNIDHYAVEAAAPENATEAFPVTVTAEDPFNNPVTTDSATQVTLGSSTGDATFDSNPVTLTNGVFTVNTTDNIAETVDLTATDSDGKTGTLSALVVNAAPASGDYRSATSGNWNTTSTWQTFNGLFWLAASSTPTSQKVTIQNGHTVAVTRNVTVRQVIVQSGGTITNAQNLTLNGNGTALDIFGTVSARGLQTTETGTTTGTTNWALAANTTTIVENGGSVGIEGGDLDVGGTLIVAGGTVTTAAGDDISGSGTMSISNGTITVGVPGHRNDFSVDTLNMTGGLLFFGGNFSSIDGSLTGGTVQFAATDNNFQISQFTYANVILSNNATVRLNLGNGSTVINGDLRITGTTVVLVSGPLTAHSLTLGGTTQGAGTWGGLNSGAGIINTTYFSPASPGDYITVTTGKGLVVTLPGQAFTSGGGNSGTVSNQTAGTAFNLSLYAVRAGGTVLDTTYSGTKTITYSGPVTAPGGTAPSYTTNVTFINGVATNIATTLTAAQTTTITASAADGTATGVASSSLTVIAGTIIDHYAVTAASPQNATVAFLVTVTAQDPFGNTVTTDSATQVTLGSSTGHATFASNPVTLTNGVFTVNATDNTAETVNLTATDSNSKTGTLTALVIGAAPAFGDYRSGGSGNWNIPSTWQIFNGSTWVTTLITPTTQKVTIQNGHTVNVTKRVTVNQVLVQTGGTVTNAQNLRLGGSGTALDIFGTVNAEGLQTTETGTIDTTTNWPLAASTTTIVENGGSLAVNGGNLSVDGTLQVVGGTVTTTAGDDISGSGTMSILGGTVTVGAPGENNDFSVRTVNMTGGLLILGRNLSPIIENLTGGTIQFAATQTGFQIPQLTYANVILSGSIMNLNLGNGNIVINGDLSITGTTVVLVRAPLTAHSLTLGGTTQAAGTWGGLLSGAGNINTTYFTPAAPGDFITVTAGGPTITFGVVTSSANPALPGTNVTFSMTINAVTRSSGTPTGTVNFRIDGNVIGTGTLSGGVATFTTSTLTHGSHTVVGEYAGDLNLTGTTNSMAPDQVIDTPPVAGNLAIARNPVLSVKVPLSTLLTNASDADGDPLNISVSPTSANNATITVSGGLVFYSPPAGFTNADAFTYTVTDNLGVSATGTVLVTIQVNNNQSQNLTISVLGGPILIKGSGIPSYTYRLQFSDTSGPFVWQDLVSVTADGTGSFQYTDTSGSPTRFYRTVYP